MGHPTRRYYIFRSNKTSLTIMNMNYSLILAATAKERKNELNVRKGRTDSMS